MEDSTYEIMSLSPGAEVEYQESAANNFTYKLQTCQQKNTATGADDGGSRSVGGGEVEHTNMKGNSQKGMKRCLIALVFAVVLMAVVTIAALALAVINYSRLSGELTNKVNFLSGQLHQLNESKEANRELTNDINLLSIQHQQSLSSTRDNISQVVVNLNTVKSDLSSLQVQLYCGAGLWYRVAFLNMSDPSQQCPSAWRLVTTNGVRACGRPVSSESSCNGTLYSATSEYQRVCGRVIGYQDSTPDGFGYLKRGSINESYLDGVSITYAQPRNHIWSYVAGVTENNSTQGDSICPCLSQRGKQPQPFVGDNYYCESGNPNNAVMYGVLYTDDKLWDGKQCEGTCCTGSNSPPWFSVHLPNPTTESIEVRICGDQGTNDEDTPIELLEIYVQ